MVGSLWPAKKTLAAWSAQTATRAAWWLGAETKDAVGGLAEERPSVSLGLAKEAKCVVALAKGRSGREAKWVLSGFGTKHVSVWVEVRIFGFRKRD